jgi:hypothetical protein
LKPKARWKFNINLDRISCSIEEVSKYTPFDETVWISTCSATLQVWYQNFTGNVFTTHSELDTSGSTSIQSKYGDNFESAKFLKLWNTSLWNEHPRTKTDLRFDKATLVNEIYTPAGT